MNYDKFELALFTIAIHDFLLPRNCASVAQHNSFEEYICKMRITFAFSSPTYKTIGQLSIPQRSRHSINVKQGFQFDDQLPFLVADILAVKLLQAVDTGSRDQAVQTVGFFELSSIHRLVAAHFNLDGD